MIKKSIICKGLAALVAGSLFAISCQKVEESIQDVPQEAPVYQVFISASFADDATKAVSFDNDATPKPTATGRFETTEDIYVYNETTGKMLDGALHPTDISADGKSCNLTGTLTGTVTAGNRLTLTYNMNTVDANNLDYCYFSYDGQGGTEAGVIDGGLATGLTATVSIDGEGVLTTEEKASFEMQQAIFRLKFTDGTNPITVQSLLIESTGWDITAFYWPFRAESSRYGSKQITVSPTTPTNDYLYVAVCIRESETASALNFTVTDNEGYQYKGTKAAPSGGFKNGKYYYSSAATTLTKLNLEKPTITWTSVYEGAAVEPNVYNQYDVYGPWNGSDYDPSEITISDTSAGYYFYMNWGATIHLSGLTATYDGNNSFIDSDSDLNLDISGANSIACKNYDQAISASGTLKLSGSGTLTVTVSYATRYGLYATSNYNDDNNSDASVLAATGYTVSRSARTDNGDGTYTWTYTVAPQE